MYCSKTQTPHVQTSPSDLPCKAAATSAESNGARELTQVAAVAGLWSSRRVRAVILTKQAARPQPR
jgi:hypothetical protein